MPKKNNNNNNDFLSDFGKIFSSNTSICDKIDFALSSSSSNKKNNSNVTTRSKSNNNLPFYTN
jgi:hypothetical protein